MRIKCEYCGSFIDDQDEKCPFCGATNGGIKRSAIGVPQTIEELKQWYIDHNLPDENTTRFFIGRDYAGPKAFGIYKDENTGNFIVYKNKSDGTRATRYSGTDEAYAVNELYMKLKEEMMNQQAHSRSNYNNQYRSNYTTPSYANSSSQKKTNVGLIIAIVIIVLMLLMCGGVFSGCSQIYNYGGYSGGGSSYSSSYYDSDYSSSSSSSSSSWGSSWDDDDWDSSWDSSSSWDSDFGSWDSDW